MKLHVTVVWSDGQGLWEERPCELSSCATIADALKTVGYPLPDTQTIDVGIWGRKKTLDHPLREHDRVECYRPLKVDPKVARKERFGRQGARTAGLFAQRRPGAKPGY
jgi:putative ubiquitin-RnfH superfamily antitoxin RatB of RatAB toxin-antitoxin module